MQLLSRIKEAGFAPTFKDPEIEKQAKISTLSDSVPKKTISKASRAKKVLSKESEVEFVPSSEDSRRYSPPERSEMERTGEIVEQSRLQGKNVVITGEFEDYSREELEQLVILNGGQIRKSVSSFFHHKSCSYYAFSVPQSGIFHPMAKFFIAVETKSMSTYFCSPVECLLHIFISSEQTPSYWLLRFFYVI